MLDADEQNAHVRAADGRGPLWCVVVKATGYHPCVCAVRHRRTYSPAPVWDRWAHEHKNEEAITLLQEKGINENAKDRGARVVVDCVWPFCSLLAAVHAHAGLTASQTA
eukprot:SAG25_NODE_1494_length_2905_cov_1.799715_1_plen_109_part_00